ncbi:MAG: hypothetical protein WAM17_16865 [Rhodoplanes sp.]
MERLVCRSLFVREVDLPGLPLRQLMAGQEATREIVEYGLRRDSELCGYPLNREAAVRPTQRVAKHIGAHVITTASAANHEYVRGLTRLFGGVMIT